MLFYCNLLKCLYYDSRAISLFLTQNEEQMNKYSVLIFDSETVNKTKIFFKGSSVLITADFFILPRRSICWKDWSSASAPTPWPTWTRRWCTTSSRASRSSSSTSSTTCSRWKSTGNSFISFLSTVFTCLSFVWVD